MLIIGADYHPGFQQIAFVDTETGELQERRLLHREEAEKFYRDLAAQGMKLRVGMEASGHARWFERLLSELQFELWIAIQQSVTISECDGCDGLPGKVLKPLFRNRLPPTPLGMLSLLECFEVLGRFSQRLQLHRTVADHVLQRHHVQKFHHDEGLAFTLADFVDGTDVGMIQGRRCTSFPAEAFERLGVTGNIFRQELQGDEAT